MYADEVSGAGTKPAETAEMSMDVSLVDVSLRDGLQSEARYVPIETRLQLVSLLIEAGVRQLQVASFVNPARVPQMSGIEELIARLPRDPGLSFSALVLNERGLSRLRETGLRQVDLSVSAGDAHSRRNTGMSAVEARRQALAMVKAAKAAGLSVRIGVQCAFGSTEGETSYLDVLALCRAFCDAGADQLSLADSTGQAMPDEVAGLVQALEPRAREHLTLHLHDTRGLGMANLVSAFKEGVRSFDVALGGVGGCPFIPGASGNLASEDVVHLFDRLGVRTGISVQGLVPATAVLEDALGHPLPGKVYHLLRGSQRRAAATGREEAPWV